MSPRLQAPPTDTDTARERPRHRPSSPPRPRHERMLGAATKVHELSRLTLARSLARSFACVEAQRTLNDLSTKRERHLSRLWSKNTGARASQEAFCRLCERASEQSNQTSKPVGNILSAETEPHTRKKGSRHRVERVDPRQHSGPVPLFPSPSTRHLGLLAQRTRTDESGRPRRAKRKEGESVNDSRARRRARERERAVTRLAAAAALRCRATLSSDSSSSSWP